MISKSHFLAQVKKLNAIFPDTALDNEQTLIYYEFLSKDFTDEQFDVAVNVAVKNSFKFPAVAAFYKRDPDAPGPKTVTDPVSKQERELIHQTWRAHGIE